MRTKMRMGKKRKNPHKRRLEGRVLVESNRMRTKMSLRVGKMRKNPHKRRYRRETKESERQHYTRNLIKMAWRMKLRKNWKM
jgi:hypothetical protein